MDRESTRRPTSISVVELLFLQASCQFFDFLFPRRAPSSYVLFSQCQSPSTHFLNCKPATLSRLKMAFPTQKRIIRTYDGGRRNQPNHQKRSPSNAALYSEICELRKEVRELQERCRRDREERASSTINTDTVGTSSSTGNTSFPTFSSRPFSHTVPQNESLGLMRPSSISDGAPASHSDPFSSISFGLGNQTQPQIGFRRSPGSPSSTKDYHEVRMKDAVVQATDPQVPNSPFMKLPAEIRVKIFRKLLTFETAAIDLAPISPEWNKNGRLRVKHYERFWKMLKEDLPKLWLNKTTKAETLEAFYSSNEFRFSNAHGCDEAANFLRFVGDNIRFIRDLAVHIPFSGYSLKPISFGFNAEKQIDEQLETSNQGLGAARGLCGPGGGFRGCTELLEGAQNLRALKLILPSHYYIDPQVIPCDTLVEISGLPFNLGEIAGNTSTMNWHILESFKSTRSRLKIILLKLQKRPEVDDVPKPLPIFGGSSAIMPEDPINHLPLMIQASKYGWDIEEQYYDSKGHYPAVS